MNYVYILEIPVKDVYDNGNYAPQQIFFNNSPTKLEVINILTNYHDEYSSEILYDNVWLECRNVIELISDEDWPFVNPDDVIQINKFIDLDDATVCVSWIVKKVF